MRESRDLDAKISEVVFGKPVVKKTWGDQNQFASYTIGEPNYCYTSDCPEGFLTNSVPHYSSEIADAMEVFEHLRQSGKWCCLKISSDYAYVWDVILVQSSLSKGWQPGVTEEPAHEPTVVVSSEYLPLAICLAALKASEVK